MKLHKILNVIEILVLALIVVGVYTFAHVCGSMGAMKAPCHTTRLYAVIIALVLVAVAVASLIISKNGALKVLSILQIIGGIVTVFLPLFIAPVCSMKSMHCYVYTRPLLIIGGIVLIGVSLIDFIILLKKTEVK